MAGIAVRRLQRRVDAVAIRRVGEAAAGVCTEPSSTTLTTDVITHPGNLPLDIAFVVDPAALSREAVRLVAMTPVGSDGASSAVGPTSPTYS